MDSRTILDVDLNKPFANLSDFQLVGILVEQTKYPPIIYEQVKDELNNRKIDAATFAKLKKKYQEVELISEGRMMNKGLFAILLLICLFGATEIAVGMKMMIFVFSLFAVSRRFRLGITYERKMWRNLSIVLLILTASSIILGAIL